MTLTLLLDLDGTILGNEVGPFVQVYTRALAGHLARFVDPVLLATTLRNSTLAMIQNQGPDATLQDNFDAAFYPALGIEKQKIHKAIDAFYVEVFPTLRSYTHPLPEAIQLVDEAFARGYQVAIATNPLFPLTAIEQRLGWAGLPPEKYPFALVPSYETFHFAKPNPAFFTELLMLMGWTDGPVLMVGNELDHDIRPACLAGISTFMVAPQALQLPVDAKAPNRAGRLADILPWVDSTAPETLHPDFTIRPAILATLRATPAVLPALARRLPSRLWGQRPQPAEWSLTEILCHLRDVEKDVNLERFKKIVLEENPFLPGMDTDPWAEIRQYARQDGSEALWAFVDYRLQLLGLLDGLSPDGWQKPARHAIFGPTHLFELASIAASHDRLHIQQIHQLLGDLLR